MKTTPNTPFEAGDLIPEWWHLSVPSVEKLVWLGKVNIREMIRYWRGAAQSLVQEIKNLEQTLVEIEGLNPETVKTEAAKHEKPAFPSIGLREGNWTHDPEPTDAASINRKGGATTFNVCGWCKHASGGSCRYNYYITTSCGLKSRAGLSDRTRRFDTPCLWLTASVMDFMALKAGLRNRKEQAAAEKAFADRKIQTLLTLERQAEKKPALPDLRPYDWFNENDEVTCYVANWDTGDTKMLGTDPFAAAKVIIGYRHHDGCVSVCYDERVHTGEYLEGHGGGYGMSRPEVMHTWEYEYMLTHWEFMGLWLARGNRRQLEGFDAKKMASAFIADAKKRELQNAEEN